MNIILAKKKKLVTKKQSNARKQQKCWPRDFVNKQKSLGDLIDAKLSQWHDDEYDSGKDW